MGTNYYLMTKNSNLAHKYFATKAEWGGYIDEEYRIVDHPFLGYEIHLNKLSYGWRPLFQTHKCFGTFDELEQFYKKHCKSLKIYDEYGTEYSWEDYKKEIIDHSNRVPEPVKWDYCVSEFDANFERNPRKRLQTVDCTPEEAELWIPFDHIEYARTEKEAADRFGVWESWMGSGDFYQYNDPEYKIDWAKGDFS